MTDEEFLNYLVSMCDTPDAGVTPQQVARLLRLAGKEEAARLFDSQPPGVIRGCHKDILHHVGLARVVEALRPPLEITEGAVG